MLSSPSMGDLATEVERFSRRRGLFAPGTTVVVGVSGGPDSLCLLHVLRRLAPDLGFRLYVGHFNHGLRGAEADTDALFVTRLAAEWELPYRGGSADVKTLAQAAGLSIEEAARKARYSFLAQEAREVGATAVAVGHNADDQAETVLMHFLRGSGVAGLRGMLARSPLPTGQDTPPPDVWLVRPLLGTPRSAILAYCAEHGLAPRTDSSNEDRTFYRNRLRHELLPELARYNPEIRTVLVRTASVMAGDSEVLGAALRAAWAGAVRAEGPEEVVFDRDSWLALPLGLQRATVRHAVQRLRSTLRNVNWEHVERAVWLAREGHAGQSATLPAGLTLAIDYETLRLTAEGGRWVSAPDDVPQIAGLSSLADGRPVSLPRGWTVTCRQVPGENSPSDLAQGDDWTAWLNVSSVGPAPLLRPRQPGDRFQPQGLRGHSMKLNEFFINEKIPRALRDRWPLLEGSRGIAWVCGLRVAEWAAVRPGSEQVWEVRFERAP